MTAAEADLVVCRAAMARGSASFNLAARLFPRPLHDRATAVYAWCRRADDLIDEQPVPDAARALDRLEDELGRVYAGRALDDAVLRAFAAVVHERSIPRAYPAELLEGMRMDVTGARYETLEDLIVYCHRVAGTVGLMMAHVMGVRRDGALRNAAHLGIAMQLTNVCRDVAEDRARGRTYLPAAWLDAHRGSVPAVVAGLLAEADRYYRSGDAGLDALPFRCALAVRAARRIYAAIGVRLARRGWNALAGRTIVPRSTKLRLACGAVLRQLAAAAVHPVVTTRRVLVPVVTLRFPDDVLPV